MAYNFLHDDTFDGSLLPMPTLHKAIWAWIVSKARPDGRAPGGGSVLLNPIILKTYFPDAELDAIRDVVKTFCESDPDSRTDDHEGRRLLPLGRDKYAVTTYTQHAGSRLARDAERKRRYRAERQESAPPERDTPAVAESHPVPPEPPAGAADVPHGTRKPGTRHAEGAGSLTNRQWAKLMETHAFVGERLRIPQALHDQLVAQKGGNPAAADKALKAWYVELQDQMDPDEAIPNIWKWLGSRFEAWVKPQAKTVTPAPPADDDAYARSLARSSTRHARNLSSPKKEIEP